MIKDVKMNTHMLMVLLLMCFYVDCVFMCLVCLKIIQTYIISSTTRLNTASEQVYDQCRVEVTVYTSQPMITTLAKRVHIEM